MLQLELCDHLLANGSQVARLAVDGQAPVDADRGMSSRSATIRCMRSAARTILA